MPFQTSCKYAFSLFLYSDLILEGLCLKRTTCLPSRSTLDLNFYDIHYRTSPNHLTSCTEYVITPFLTITPEEEPYILGHMPVYSK